MCLWVCSCLVFVGLYERFCVCGSVCLCLARFCVRDSVLVGKLVSSLYWRSCVLVGLFVSSLFLCLWVCVCLLCFCVCGFVGLLVSSLLCVCVCVCVCV